MAHSLTGSLVLIGICLVAAVVLLVIGINIERWEDRQKQASQRLVWRNKEFTAMAQQRDRKRQVVNRLRATARQARADQERRS